MIPADKLFAYGKYITDTKLQKITLDGDYLLFHHGIEAIIEGGLLSPVKALESNGRKPLLFNKVYILSQE